MRILLGLVLALAFAAAHALPACEPREGYTLPSMETMSRRWKQYLSEARKVCIVGRLEAGIDDEYVGIDNVVKEPFVSFGELELRPLKEEMQDWILEYCKGQGTGAECVFAIYGTIVPYKNRSGRWAIRPDEMVADPAAYAR